MASYSIEVARTVEKQLAKIPALDQRRIIKAIQSLADNPRPQGCRRLTGYEDIYRIRVGYYRVLYSVNDSTITIIILKLGHRKDIYR